MQEYIISELSIKAIHVPQIQSYIYKFNPTQTKYRRQEEVI